MIVPKGTTEDEVLKTIDKVLKQMSKRFVFGIYSKEDIYQEGFIIALNALAHYDESLPLENYLKSCLYNRLTSLKRQNYVRSNNVCDNCEVFNKDCELCQKRRSNYLLKWNFNNPIDISTINADGEKSLADSFDSLEEVETVELLNLINKHLPVEYREDYLRMRDGIYVNKGVRETIENIIIGIISEYT